MIPATTPYTLPVAEHDASIHSKLTRRPVPLTPTTPADWAKNEHATALAGMQSHKQFQIHDLVPITRPLTVAPMPPPPPRPSGIGPAASQRAIEKLLDCQTAYESYRFIQHRIEGYVPLPVEWAHGLGEHKGMKWDPAKPHERFDDMRKHLARVLVHTNKQKLHEEIDMMLGIYIMHDWLIANDRFFVQVPGMARVDQPAYLFLVFPSLDLTVRTASVSDQPKPKHKHKTKARITTSTLETAERAPQGSATEDDANPRPAKRARFGPYRVVHPKPVSPDNEEKESYRQFLWRHTLAEAVLKLTVHENSNLTRSKMQQCFGKNFLASFIPRQFHPVNACPLLLSLGLDEQWLELTKWRSQVDTMVHHVVSAKAPPAVRMQFFAHNFFAPGYEPWSTHVYSKPQCRNLPAYTKPNLELLFQLFWFMPASSRSGYWQRYLARLKAWNHVDELDLAHKLHGAAWLPSTVMYYAKCPPSTLRHSFLLRGRCRLQHAPLLDGVSLCRAEYFPFNLPLLHLDTPYLLTYPLAMRAAQEGTSRIPPMPLEQFMDRPFREQYVRMQTYRLFAHAYGKSVADVFMSLVNLAHMTPANPPNEPWYFTSNDVPKGVHWVAEAYRSLLLKLYDHAQGVLDMLGAERLAPQVAEFCEKAVAGPAEAAEARGTLIATTKRLGNSAYTRSVVQLMRQPVLGDVLEETVHLTRPCNQWAFETIGFLPDNDEGYHSFEDCGDSSAGEEEPEDKKKQKLAEAVESLGTTRHVTLKIKPRPAPAREAPFLYNSDDDGEPDGTESESDNDEELRRKMEKEVRTAGPSVSRGQVLSRAVVFKNNPEARLAMERVHRYLAKCFASGVAAPPEPGSKLAKSMTKYTIYPMVRSDLRKGANGPRSCGIYTSGPTAAWDATGAASAKFRFTREAVTMVEAVRIVATLKQRGLQVLDTYLRQVHRALYPPRSAPNVQMYCCTVPSSVIAALTQPEQKHSSSSSSSSSTSTEQRVSALGLLANTALDSVQHLNVPVERDAVSSQVVEGTWWELYSTVSDALTFRGIADLLAGNAERTAKDGLLLSEIAELDTSRATPADKVAMSALLYLLRVWKSPLYEAMRERMPGLDGTELTLRQV